MDLLDAKKQILKDLRDTVNVRKVVNNEHSQRKPIFCGMTVHPGYGCSLGCLYCYVYDMEISGVKASDLTGVELVYALAFNKYFLPKKTLIAIGSITEPFLPEIESKTYEFMESISKYLKNPIQVSTKLCPSDPKRLIECDECISFLMSFSSYLGELEPSVNVLDRIECLKKITNLGIEAVGFIRPIVPGITEKHIDKLLISLKEAGVRAIVLGSLRVTPRVLNILSKRFHLKEISKRIKRRFKDRNDQVPLDVRDLKMKIKKIAKELGLRIFPFACSANIISHKMSCNLCHLGPCGRHKIGDEESIYEYFESRRIKVEVLEFSRDIIVIKLVKGKYQSYDKVLLETYYKIPIKVK